MLLGNNSRMHAGNASGGMFTSSGSGSRASSGFRGRTVSSSLNAMSTGASSHSSRGNDSHTHNHNHSRSHDGGGQRRNRRSKNHESHAWDRSPAVHGIPVIGAPPHPNYVPVDEEQGTCQKLPENVDNSPCSHFSKYGWCPLAKICKHAHDGGRSVTANLRGHPIRPGRQVRVLSQHNPTSHASCSSGDSSWLDPRHNLLPPAPQNHIHQHSVI